MKDNIRSRDGIIGLAIGDAMGRPLKGIDRKQLIENPVVFMKGDGTYGRSTYLTLSTMDSIIKCFGISTEDMEKRLYDWIEKNEPLKEESIENDCLKRMLPIAYYCHYSKLQAKYIYDIVKKVCYVTHVQDISVLGCYIYVLFAIKLLEGKNKFDAYRELKKASFSHFSRSSLESYSRIIKKDIYEIEFESVKSTTYIIDTLEAVLWVLLNTDGYNQAIIGAINLGNETDTIGACVGGLAGIIYGIESINSDWKIDLKKYSDLRKMCDSFDKLLIPNTKIFEIPKFINGKEEKIIKIIQGNITKLTVDAYLNPANNSLLGGDGIDGMIHNVAGAELLEKCKQLNGCETGNAKITRGYNSKAKYIIHTVAPKWYDDTKNKESKLKACYENSLDLATDFECRKIAIPPLGIGVYGCPIEIAAKVAIDFVLNIARKEEQNIDTIYLVCAGNTEYEYYMKYFKESLEKKNSF